MHRERSAGRFCIAAIGVVAALMLSATPAIAQDDATIIGQVRDNSGGVLPGVTVTAASPALQVRQVTTVTDGNGEYRLAQLPIGTYDISYELVGFGSIRNEAIRLTVGFVAKLDVTMKVGELQETITVTGQAPIVDVTSTTTSTQLSREVLETIPVSRVGMTSLLATAPGVRTALDIGGSTALNVPAFRAFGQSGQQWTTLEGITSTQSRPNAAFGNYFDFAVVAEANVRSSGANADMPFRGIQLEQVVKSGGNEFHGSAYGTWTGASLSANNISADLAAVGIRAAKLRERRDTTADLGGRIIRDKLWFYGGVTQNVHKADVLDHLTDDGSPGYRRQQGTFTTLKLSYQASPSLRVIGFSQWGNKLDFNPYGTTTTMWEARSEQNHTTNSAKIEVQKTFRDLVVSAQVGRFGYGGPWHQLADSGVARLNSTTGIQTGSHWGLFSPGIVASSYDTQASAKAVLYKPDLFLGNHEFKAGMFLQFYDLGLASYTRTVKNPSIGVDFTAPDYELIYIGAANPAPSQIEIRNTDVEPSTRSNWTGTYLQDNWVIGRRVTVNLGVRWDRDNAFNPEQCREASPTFPELFTAQCFDQVQFKIHNTFSPRAHTAWDVVGNGKTVVKGGWGRFYERRALEPEGVAANRMVDQRWRFRWRDLNGNNDYDRGEVNLDRNGTDFLSINPTSNGVPNVTDERPARSDEWMASVEHQLSSTMAVRATGIYSTNRDRKAFSNPLRPYSAYNIPVTRRDPGVDGVVGNSDDGDLVTYWEYAPALAGAQFVQSYAINLDELDSSFVSYELAISRRMANRFMFQASYSSTKSDDPVAVGVGQLVTYNPNAFINANDNGTEWNGKLSGAYQLPLGFTFSALWDVRSGGYWARTAQITGGVTIPNTILTVEEPTARRLDTIQHLDLRIDKRFSLRGHRLSVRMNLYNAFNVATVTGVNNRSGAQFGRPTGVLAARIIDFGATYSF